MVKFNASPSGGSRNHGATIHGHSSADDEREVDQTNFFRAVSKYLQQHEDIDQNIPVVLFAEPRQQAVYREVSKSQRISEALSIDKSPAKLTLAEVRDAVSVIQTQWQALRTQSLTAQYDKAVGQQLVLDRIDTMIEPATNGQIRTLYVSPDSRFEGYFTADQEGQFTIVDQLQDDIIEKISDIVWQQGGDIEVVALQAIQSQSPAVAILRY
ncbi:MAG: baeRF6 domain-containing protein, partial [Leuconostoc fallax]